MCAEYVIDVQRPASRRLKNVVMQTAATSSQPGLLPVTRLLD
jgi:hypothetical protein